MNFCSNCGTKLNEKVKFCSNCGVAVGYFQNEHSKTFQTETQESEKENKSQRQQEYAGKILKCPNCGELINSFTLVCTSCGYEFRGLSQKSSVYELAEKLEEIEIHRPPKKIRTFKDELFGIYGKFSTEDEKKINLIRNFVIPNTKEDILEFMILASSNIDMKLYGTESNIDETGVQRAISDAWMAKFEQAYQKAQFSFSGSPEFTKIQKIYSEKTKEMQKQKKKKAMELPLLFGMMFGIIILSLVAFAIVK